MVPVLRVVAGEKRIDLLRWGLIPSWAKGIPPKYSTINATREKLAEAPTWRGPWRRGQRCLMLSSGFYEWQDRPEGKQPYFIALGTQKLFGFAGLWDTSTREEGTVIESCAIITMPANPVMAEIHNTKHRQPLVVREEDRDAWLTADPDSAAAILQRPDESWRAHAVSKRVNSPKNNDAALIEQGSAPA
jgi:putative SOS response-associated peptidase YedK